MRSTSCASLVVLMCLGSAPAVPLAGSADGQAKDAPLSLPNAPDSFKFAVLGESGTGETAQYELARQMVALRHHFKYDDVLLLGGNVHGGERPQDFVKKFEVPYKALLDAGATFHAALGNEDSREQRYYRNFNMGGKLYYTFQPRPDLLFIALETTYVENDQIAWLESQLHNSTSAWKIVYLHHPPYSSGRRHGSDAALRKRLEPLFIKHNVSVVFSAHDHIYERTMPQNASPTSWWDQAGKSPIGGSIVSPASPRAGSIPILRSWRRKSVATRCTSTPSREPGGRSIPE